MKKKETKMKQLASGEKALIHDGKKIDVKWRAKKDLDVKEGDKITFFFEILSNKPEHL